MSDKREIDQVLNITGLLQPQSGFLVKKTLERVKDGGVLEIVSDNQNSNLISSVCPKNKFKIIEKKEVRGLYHFTIIKK